VTTKAGDGYQTKRKPGCQAGTQTGR
jgi:hypothetical protein